MKNVLTCNKERFENKKAYEHLPTVILTHKLVTYKSKKLFLRMTFLTGVFPYIFKQNPTCHIL